MSWPQRSMLDWGCVELENSMTEVNITELRNRLSFYLAKVKRGEVVIVMERGVPFAKIVPLKNSNDQMINRI